MVWSGASRSARIKCSTDRRKPSAWRSGNPKTSRTELARAVRISVEQRDARLAEEPETYYLTDHYVNHPCVLVRLSRVHTDALRDLVQMAWRYVSSRHPRKQRRRK